jgi:uncharacterized protein with HEPN domain
MEGPINTWLFDILQSIKEIESYFPDPSAKKFEAYTKDVRTKRAVERNLEIIGEAVNRILQKENNFKLSNAEKIIGTRNRIIHGYDSVSDETIWSIVINHLPKLKAEIESLIVP